MNRIFVSRLIRFFSFILILICNLFNGFSANLDIEDSEGECLACVFRDLGMIGEYVDYHSVKILSKNFDNSWIETKDKHIIKINLSKMRLKGDLNKINLSCFPHLAEIDLSHNDLFGKITDTVGDLSKIKSIKLNDNNIVEPIPEIISKLSNLKYLDLSNNFIHSEFPDFILRLPELEVCNLGNNIIEGDVPSSLYSSKRIRVLDLSDNQIEGRISSDIGKTLSLEQLYLQGNRICNPLPDELFLCKSLRIINLSNNEIFGNLPDIGAYEIEDSKIEELNLSYNYLSGSIPGSIFRVCSELLDLSHNMLEGPFPIWHYKTKRILLQHNRLSSILPLLTKEGRYHFYNLFDSKLVELDLSGNYISGSLLYLVQILPPMGKNLKVLLPKKINIEDNYFTGDIPLQYTWLESFSIRNNSLYSENPEVIDFLTAQDGDWWKFQRSSRMRKYMKLSDK